MHLMEYLEAQKYLQYMQYAKIYKISGAFVVIFTYKQAYLIYQY